MSSNNSGNQTFTRVVNVAAPIDELTVGKLSVAQLALPGQVIGYLPSGYSSGSCWLNNAPNLANNTGTAYATGNLVLPAGAYITRVSVESGAVDLSGPLTVNVGQQAFGSVPSGATDLVNTGTTISINQGGGVVCQAAPAAMASAGATPGVAVIANSGITFTPSGAITGGTVIVKITYSV